MIQQERLLKVLKAPHISEKATNNAEKGNTIVFKVALDANKVEIAKLILYVPWLLKVKLNVTVQNQVVVVTGKKLM